MQTNKELVEYCQSVLKLPTRYMWGGLMRKTTPAYVTQLKKMYPSQYTTSRVSEIYKDGGNSYGCDCIGLIKSFWFGGVGSPNYGPQKDVNTNGLYNSAVERGQITTLPEIPGIIVYMTGHVGVYEGNEKVIECTLGKYGDGVVRTDLKGRGWTMWLKAPYIEYIEEPEETPSCFNCANYRRKESKEC